MDMKGKARADPGFSLELFFTHLVSTNIELLLGRLSVLSSDCSIEQIHQSRVLIRTLCAHLDTFGPALSKPITRTTRTQLKRLDDLLAPLRNTDVTLKLLATEFSSSAPPQMQTDELLINLINRLRQQRVEQVGRLCEELELRQTFEIKSDVHHYAHDLPIRTKVSTRTSVYQNDLVHSCLEGALDKLFELIIGRKRHLSNRELHRLRIQAKQVMYSYGAAQTAGIVRDPETIYLCSQLHKLLGRHQDLVMMSSWLSAQDVPSQKFIILRQTWLDQIAQEEQKVYKKYQRLLATSAHSQIRDTGSRTSVHKP